MPDSSILITGAAGFIGSCLVQFLNEKGYTNLLLCDDFGAEEKRRNWENKQFEHIIERYNLFDWLELHDPKIDFVFHLGARTDTTEFDYAIHQELNVDFTESLWRWCTEKSVPLVYASSAATYGAGELGYEDDENIIPQLHPLNPYGVSKNEIDKWVLQQASLIRPPQPPSKEELLNAIPQTYSNQPVNQSLQPITKTTIQNSEAANPGLSPSFGGVGEAPPFWAGLKFFNVYGPNEYHKGRMASVIWHSFNQIKKTGQVKLFKSYRLEYEDGWQLRDFIYVKDVVKVMYWMMESSMVNGEWSIEQQATEALSIEAAIHDSQIEKNPEEAKKKGDWRQMIDDEKSWEDEQSSTHSPFTIHHSPIPSAIYNLGTGTARSFYDLAAATFRGLDREPNIVFIDMPEDIRDKYQYFTQADMHKLRAAGYTEPFYTLEDGITDYVRNYLAAGKMY